jgi:hypothetical protein
VPGRAFLAGLLLLAATLAATRAGLDPPAPAPVDAAAGSFSAGRALPVLGRLLDAAGPGVPHPAGSAAAARVREAAAAELRALGIEPREDRSLACSRYLACTPVSNLVARIPGRAKGAPVLVSAHTDSVPAGPGAADDGSGVAIAVELARALRAEPAASDVVLLLDDAEEAGLGGALAFLRAPEAREAGAFVNLEARGTGGPSLLFETAGPSARVARAFATAPRPVGSSLFAAVYGALPNDTNLTVLRSLGLPSANLAFIEGAVRYHTPRDDLAHLDPGTLQQQGENALALVRALAEGGGGEGEATWFDLLGRVVVRWPAPLSLPLSFLALFLALLAAAVAVRRAATGPGRMALGALSLPVALGAAAALGIGSERALGLDPLLRPWVASPGPLVATFVLAGLAGAALPPLLLGVRAGAEGLRSGMRILLSVLAVAVAAWAPGASYLLVVPSLAWGLVPAACPRPSRAAPLSDLAALLAGSLVLLPPAWLLYPALGHLAGPAVAATMALTALPLASLAAGLTVRARVAAVLVPAVAATAALAVALLVPVADADAPERVVVYFHQDLDAERARVLASPDTGRLPPELRSVAPFSDTPAIPFGWGTLRPSFSAAAAPLPLPGPELALASVTREGGALRWRGRLTSPRGADEIQLALPPSVNVVSAAVDGVAVPPPAPKLARWFGGWAVYRFHAGPEGVEVEMEIATPGALEMVLADRSSDLPPEAARVAAARPRWVVTVQEGDGTLFTRRVRIEAPEPPVR